MLRRSALLFVLGVTALAAGGCKTQQHAAVKELTVAEAVAAHQAGAVFLDANTEDFRKSNGKVPGAVLLASYRDYDVKTALPQSKDTPLVFYCSNKL
jgi:ABC-type glycerol-3-phosphate transport system substrate-binding protein